jgi:hypothetical protein
MLIWASAVHALHLMRAAVRTIWLMQSLLNFVFVARETTGLTAKIAGFARCHRHFGAHPSYATRQIFGILLLHQGSGRTTHCFRVAMLFRPLVPLLWRVHLVRELVPVEAKKCVLKVVKNAIKALGAAFVARCTTTKTMLATNVRIHQSQLHCLQLWR